MSDHSYPWVPLQTPSESLVVGHHADVHVGAAMQDIRQPMQLPLPSVSSQVICPSCSTENPTGASFCMNCGSALEQVCSNCSFVSPASARFCPNCGHALGEAQMVSDKVDDASAKVAQGLKDAASRGAVRGERRTITMLFCDVIGSTSAAEQLDPEVWSEIMNGAFKLLIEPVDRYDGTVAQLMGDAILAFWGAPIAHEDDPQRAVLAALDILSAIEGYSKDIKAAHGLDFKVRIGLNTGLAVVGGVGSDQKEEYTALGDEVNVAARMEQIAEPGTIRITNATARLITNDFELEPLGPVEVKGKSEPVVTHRVVRAKTTRIGGGEIKKLIGRERELTTLRASIDDLRRGVGHAVAVVGETGLGKTRLLAEMERSIDLENQADPGIGIKWLEARARSYDSATPYAPFVALLEDCFEIEAGDSDETRYAKVKNGVGVVLTEGVDQLASYLCTLLGIDMPAAEMELVRYMEPQQLRPRVFAAVAAYLGALAERHPVVAVFDDLHWADTASVDLLGSLMPLADSTALLLVTAFRPDREAPSWRLREIAEQEHAHRYTEVRLAPLTEHDASLLLEDVLESETTPPELGQLVLSRTEGNPLFIEEVIRSLIDREIVVHEDGVWRLTSMVGRIDVPENIAAVLVSRLDQLDLDTRYVAQVAAVIGREFSYAMLAGIVDQPVDVEGALASLQQRMMVRTEQRIPDRILAFRHALTQEAAYDAMLMKTRSSIHAHAGDWLEQHRPDRPGEIARHLLAAGEPGRALPHQVSAAEIAFAAYSVDETITHIESAVEQLREEPDPELVKRAYPLLSRAQAFSGDVASSIATLEEMLQIGRDLEDVPIQVSAFNKLGFFTALMMGNIPEGERLLEQAEKLAEETGQDEGMAECHVFQCGIKKVAGKLEEAAVHERAAAELGAIQESAFARTFGATHYADTMLYMTDYAATEQAINDALAVAEESGEQQFIAHLRGHTMPLLQLTRGDLDGALEAARAGSELATRIGAPEAAITRFTESYIARELGLFEAALDALHATVDIGKATGQMWLIPQALASEAIVDHYTKPDIEPELRRMHEDAEAQLHNPVAGAVADMVWADMALCRLVIGDLDVADSYVNSGLAADGMLRNLVRPQLLIVRALISLANGQTDEARSVADQADEFITNRSMRHMMPIMGWAMAQVLAAEGDLAGALDRLATAETLAREMRSRPWLGHVLLLEAALLADLGRTAESEAKAADHREVTSQIADDISDGSLRESFLAASGAG